MPEVKPFERPEPDKPDKQVCQEVKDELKRDSDGGPKPDQEPRKPRIERFRER
jgi:hypothetical protein